MSKPLAPCFKTRLRHARHPAGSAWTPGPDVITAYPYNAAKEALADVCEKTPDLWLDERVEVQVVDFDLVGTQEPHDLDWDTYSLIARQTLTISDA